VATRRPRASEPAPIDLNPRTDPPLDFPDRSWGELTARDYDILGFMCGLEVHQQLATRGKLFCRCPAGRRTRHVDASVLRHMRPTLSELGEYDGCALMEFRTKKEIVYLLHRETVCTYEIDDTPPFPIDEEAVKFALEVSALFGLSRVSELQVMRKQYLDGSIPTGFQRTAMVGLGGEIPFRESELGSDRVLRIRQLTLEEDSCREVSDVGHHIVFRTDRLGTPLIETVTEPDLLTPGDVATGGRLLARVARASGKVRRGAGAARQDVNVSIAGSRRVELKGVDRHAVLPRLVHNEAYRHLNLLRVRQALLDRGVTAAMLEPDRLDPPWDGALVRDVRSIVARAPLTWVREALDRGEVFCAVRLRGFAGLLRHRTQPGRIFADEIADRLRVIACLTGRPFMAHTDDPAPPLPPGLLDEMRVAVGAEEDDAVVVAWGSPDDAATAAEEILTRARDALKGVPSETRQAFGDGTTGFERILPGAERMYPDTDTPPLPIPDAWIEAIDVALAERPWDRVDRYVAQGLDLASARRLVASSWADLFDALAPSTEVGRRRLASALERRLVHWWRETGQRALPLPDRLRPLVAAIDAGTVRPEAYDEVFDALLRAPGDDAPAILDRVRARGSEVELDRRVAEVAAARRAHAFTSAEGLLRWAMGRVMPAVLGGRDPEEVRGRLLAALEGSR
jgi:glutamyl-tRNA(Gln) amidotransferase subunit E